ncbi:uncharacterized protein LOC135494797 [Lineus longissimus]|uniref:uncharacterized protein LOC135494797 n=1 Tax=Lineus longissimus TaxID=88925 RepID=UPI002B4C4A83
MFTMDPYPNFRCRFILKYVTLIAFVITVFGTLYMMSKDDITRESRSEYKHPSVHIWHPKAGSKLSKLLRLREQMGASAYRPVMPGVASGMKFYFENDSPMVRFVLKRYPHYVTLANAPKPTMVLPLSNRRYEEGLDTIESAQRHLPRDKIMVYNLGLTSKQKSTLVRLCNVRLIEFPFRKFPPYVRLLMKFHWKPILLQLALNEYGSVLWLESSTRLTTGDLSQAIKEAKETGIKIFGIKHAYSTYSVTHPGMLKYLPTNMRRLKVSGQTQTAPMIIYHTKDIERKFTKWLVLCGLERFCLAPLLSKRRCNGLKTNKASKHARYLNCHRFDQSAINILLKNMFDYDTSKFISKHSFSVLKRGPAKHSKNLKYCIGPAKSDPHQQNKILAVEAHLAAGRKRIKKPKVKDIPVHKVQGQIRGQGQGQAAAKVRKAQKKREPAKDPSVKGFLKNKARKAVKKPSVESPGSKRNRREAVQGNDSHKDGSGIKKAPLPGLKRPKSQVLGFHDKVQARLRYIRRMRRKRAYQAYINQKREQQLKVIHPPPPQQQQQQQQQQHQQQQQQQEQFQQPEQQQQQEQLQPPDE